MFVAFFLQIKPPWLFFCSDKEKKHAAAPFLQDLSSQCGVTLLRAKDFDFQEKAEIQSPLLLCLGFEMKRVCFFKCDLCILYTLSKEGQELLYCVQKSNIKEKILGHSAKVF